MYTCTARQASCSTAVDQQMAGLTPAGAVQVAQEVFGLSRVVRTFGTEDREVGRYRRCLQATAEHQRAAGVRVPHVPHRRQLPVQPDQGHASK